MLECSLELSPELQFLNKRKLVVVEDSCWDAADGWLMRGQALVGGRGTRHMWLSWCWLGGQKQPCGHKGRGRVLFACEQAGRWAMLRLSDTVVSSMFEQKLLDFQWRVGTLELDSESQDARRRLKDQQRGAERVVQCLVFVWPAPLGFNHEKSQIQGRAICLLSQHSHPGPWNNHFNALGFVWHLEDRKQGNFTIPPKGQEETSKPSTNSLNLSFP